MIYEVEESILSNLPKQSVILNQCNNKGWIGNGISSKIHSKYPQAFNDYHEYCRWFLDGHEHEILGTWARTRVNENLIICNAITQNITNKSKYELDYDSWNNILKKIELQTKKINSKYGNKWTIHILNKFSKNSDDENSIAIHHLIETYFKNSQVDIVFHKN